MNIEPLKKVFKVLISITILAVYFLILVNGIVRSTGQGMGCPDLPKCFGLSYPAKTFHELPYDYGARYETIQQNKMDGLSASLSRMGLMGLSEEIEISRHQSFNYNPEKALFGFIDYYLGLFVGLLVTINLVVASLLFLESKRLVFLSIGSFVLTGFYLVLEYFLVSTFELFGVFSIQLAVVCLLLISLIYVRFHISRTDWEGVMTHKPYKVRRLLMVCMILFIAQLLLGSQVREVVDDLLSKFDMRDRNLWMGELGLIYYAHRFYGILLLLLHVYLVFRLTKSVADFSSAKLLVWMLIGFFVLQVVSGIVLSNFAFPKVFQSAHLVVAMLIFGVQYFLYLLIQEKVELSEVGDV